MEAGLGIWVNQGLTGLPTAVVSGHRVYAGAGGDEEGRLCEPTFSNPGNAADRYCIRVADESERCVRDRFAATPTVSPADHARPLWAVPGWKLGSV